MARCKDYMHWAVGCLNAELEPCSAILSAFLQRLHTLDAPEMLSAVVKRSSWPPRGMLGSSETLSQLTLTPSLGSTCGSIARKRKGSSDLAERARLQRKSKAEGAHLSQTLLCLICWRVRANSSLAFIYTAESLGCKDGR